MTLCETCVSTCCRTWTVGVTAEEAPTYGEAVTLTDRHGWLYVGELKRRPDGACVFLGPDGCGVYERRPKACRDYVANERCGYQPDPLKQLGLVRLRSIHDHDDGLRVPHEQQSPDHPEDAGAR